jgi:DivIVA domain-containing protein
VDRDSIERRDFPVGRRGYDPAAVDAHLRRVADEMESLRDRPAPAPPTPLAAGTSEQVRAILEAAEAGAAQLRAGAGEEVARVGEAADEVLGRLDRLEGELGGLLESLRRSNERLADGLARLRLQAGEPAPDPGSPPAPAEDFAAAAPAPEGGDEAGARLIALNMALSGTPREETARFLAEHFDLPDQDALLDDVYQRAGR